MDRIGMLLLTVLLVSASSSSTVQAKLTRYQMQIYEKLHQRDCHVFQPLQAEPVLNKGNGWVRHNDLVHTASGNLLGSTAGLAFWHTANSALYFNSITFSTNLGGVWGGSTLHLQSRGGQAYDGPHSEMSIMGGQGGLKGARGTAYYDKVPGTSTTYMVTLDIYVDDFESYMPITHVDLDTQFKSYAEVVKIQPEFVTVPETTFDVPKQALESS